MGFQPASLSSLTVFLSVVILVILILLTASLHVQKLKENVIFLSVWIFASSIPALTGLIAQHPLPWIPIFFALVFVSAFVFAFSSIGTAIAVNMPFSFLVLFHGFRAPLELVLYAWALEGTIPETMTWMGYNYDVISGILAILVYFLCDYFPRLIWIFNVIGGVLLLNVIGVAAFSSPLPFGWAVEPKLELIAYFPYVLIATVCVWGALVGHIVLTRALLLPNGVHKPKYAKIFDIMK